MAEHHEIYRRARYYDIAFRRDVGREVDFLLAACRHHAGAEPASLLDIACGPGYHAWEAARRGLRSIGLDLRPEMLELAAAWSAAQGARVEWLAADMRDFRLDRPVDLAICMFDSLDALLSNDDIVRHLRIVASNLGPHGLYVLESTHPRDCSVQSYGDFRYEGRRDGVAVQVTWPSEPPVVDLVAGTAEVAIELRVNERGRPLRIVETAKERFPLLPQEIVLLAERSGAFEAIGWYGDFDLDQPLDMSLASRHVICVLHKTRTPDG
ncbi:MAG: class I SAM-dependent methyltransferase [Geminicoccaceae bacterium]